MDTVLFARARALCLVPLIVAVQFGTAHAQSAAPVWAKATISPSATPGDARSVTLLARTSNTYSSMCGRSLTSFKVANPSLSRGGVGIPRPALGSIEVTTELKPGGICLAAFGPHSTGVTLARGPALPALEAGYFQITIDRQPAGILFLGATSATIIDFNDLPQ